MLVKNKAKLRQNKHQAYYSQESFIYKKMYNPLTPNIINT